MEFRVFSFKGLSRKCDCIFVITFSLTDIDECKIGNGRCDHKCINTDGSYHCMCKRGYKQAHDGRKCRGNESLVEATPFPQHEKK